MNELAASPVAFYEVSHNAKLSPVDKVENTTDRLRPVARAPFCSSTRVSIEATCPDSCVFKAGGCYERAGFTAKLTRNMDTAARESRLRGRDVAALEAAAILDSFGGGRIPHDGLDSPRWLRLHVGGDVYDAQSARHLAVAVEDYIRRGGAGAWTFTARWRAIPRSAWGPISVLASCSTLYEVHDALALGYAPAITVRELPGAKAFDMAGARIIPCPAETRGRTCLECGLCLHADRLERRLTGVAFQLHGPAAHKAYHRLPVLRTAAPAPLPMEDA